MLNHFVNDKPQELFAEHRVEPRILGQRTEASDLDGFAVRVGRGKADLGFMLPDALGNFEAFGQQVNKGGIDVVDAAATFCEYWVIIHNWIVAVRSLVQDVESSGAPLSYRVGNE